MSVQKTKKNEIHLSNMTVVPVDQHMDVDEVDDWNDWNDWMDVDVIGENDMQVD